MRRVKASMTNSIADFIVDHFQAVEVVKIVAEPIADLWRTLPEDEQQLVADAVSPRQQQFATGRCAARKAITALGMPPCSIGRDDSRRPIWPQGCVGSISHTASFAAAAAASAQAVKGIGIDLEESERVVPELHRKLFTTWERERYANDDARWTSLVFGAKEAAYKAVNPLVGDYIGFQEVEVDVDWSAQAFTVRYCGQQPPNKLMDVGFGRFGFFEDHVVSLFVIP